MLWRERILHLTSTDNDLISFPFLSSHSGKCLIHGSKWKDASRYHTASLQPKTWLHSPHITSQCNTINLKKIKISSLELVCIIINVCGFFFFFFLFPSKNLSNAKWRVLYLEVNIPHWKTEHNLLQFILFFSYPHSPNSPSSFRTPLF